MATAVRAAGGGRKKNDAFVGVGDSSLTRIAPPEELRDENSRTIWKVQSKKMIESGVMAVEFIPLLIAYCNSYSLMMQADQLILQDGLTDMSEQGGLKKHPAVNVRNDCVSQLARLGSLMGLDPLSRSRMLGASGDGSGEDENEFDDF